MSKLDPVAPITESRDPDIFTMYPADPFDPYDDRISQVFTEETARGGGLIGTAVRARYMSNVFMCFVFAPLRVCVRYTHGESAEVFTQSMTFGDARRLSKMFGARFDHIEAGFARYAPELKGPQ
jgi:hypothetical protein